MKNTLYTRIFLATTTFLLVACSQEDSSFTDSTTTYVQPLSSNTIYPDILNDSSVAFLWPLVTDSDEQISLNNSFTYNWSTTESPQKTQTGTEDGTYNVVVTDANCCAMSSNGGTPLYSNLSPPAPSYSLGFSPPTEKSSAEKYDKINSNKFESALEKPVSTLSIDVDNASYSNIRRFLEGKEMPPVDAVRIEEMINYFDYSYPQPKDEHPFSVNMELSVAPWDTEHHLIHLGLQGKSLDYKNIKPSNLVFLIDASGSMSDENKLPLLKKALGLLLNQLNANDKVAVVVYAGAAGLVLNSTAASNKKMINASLENLQAGGSTAGGEGIELAYKIAKENLIVGGNNRVILATDGDFNVGLDSNEELVSLIEEKRKDGIYLTICGFGMGNYNDGAMEQISNAGNGNYFYIDNLKEAEKVFVKEMRANMFTIAKDVKIQVEFNPKIVKSYRLIGYENRILAKEDFDNDTKDAGELGAGHTVTAIYEVVLLNSNSKQDLMSVKFRYKPPTSDKSILLEKTFSNNITDFTKTSNNFRFSAAVAGFGMLLRNSEFKGNASYDFIGHLAKEALGVDKNGYRKAFLSLVKSAKQLTLAQK